MTFHTTLQRVQNYCVLDSIKHEFIKVWSGEFRYLVLFDYGLFDKIFEKIKYLIIEKK